MKEKRESRFMQTYLFDKRIRVSTGWRQCSAILAPDVWYYETIVFQEPEDSSAEFNDKILYMEDSSSHEAHAYKRHQEIVARIINGKPLEDPEEIEEEDQ